jgi:hypothetical protein
VSVADERFQQGDVFIDYDFEEVMFRYDFVSARIFRKFYGKSHETEVQHDNRLFNDPIMSGDEIDANRIAWVSRADISERGVSCRSCISPPKPTNCQCDDRPFDSLSPSERRYAPAYSTSVT